jgi:hypothetical protein
MWRSRHGGARPLEPFGRAWIELALVRGAGRGVAFGLLRR